MVSPLLKWAGGKRQLLPEILANHLPLGWDSSQHRYYEPFIGGAALLLALQPERAVIGDQNWELINCYKVVRYQLPELVAALKSHRNEASHYYWVRKWDRMEGFDQRSDVDRAARIIFLNKTGYNGLYRVNGNNQFNVPFGSYKNPRILDVETLTAVQDYLRSNKIDILYGDFEVTVRSAKSGDFIYFDPPYDPVSPTAKFTSYGPDKFSRDDQTRLRDTFVDLHKRGCHVLLSNSDTPFIRELYEGFGICAIDAKRNINSDGKKRGKVPELLIKNYSQSHEL